MELKNAGNNVCKKSIIRENKIDILLHFMYCNYFILLHFLLGFTIAFKKYNYFKYTIYYLFMFSLLILTL